MSSNSQWSWLLCCCKVALMLLSIRGFVPTTSRHKSNLWKYPSQSLHLVDDAKSSTSKSVNGADSKSSRLNIDDITAPVDWLLDKAKISKLKHNLLLLGASYDRGFSSTSRARDQASTIISKLSTLNPETNASQGIDGYDNEESSDSPLFGSWRMVWTTAIDVLVLGANPLVSPGAIYQVFDPPMVTNIIDLLPRQQNLLPINELIRFESLLRAKVQTRASSRKNQTMQIGLVFESVKLEPIEFLGNDMAFVPPIGFNLPQLPFVTSLLGDDNNTFGYFDVLFLDEELLIIRQTSGGMFALAKVDNFDP